MHPEVFLSQWHTCWSQKTTVASFPNVLPTSITQDWWLCLITDGLRKSSSVAGCAHFLYIKRRVHPVWHKYAPLFSLRSKSKCSRLNFWCFRMESGENPHKRNQLWWWHLPPLPTCCCAIHSHHNALADFNAHYLPHIDIANKKLSCRTVAAWPLCVDTASNTKQTLHFTKTKV